MITPQKTTRSRENDLPPKVQAAISFSRMIIGGMAVERLEGRWNEGRIPGPLESAVYDGALLVLLEYFEAPDLREKENAPTPRATSR
jgi:hypothetical protein